MKAIHLILIAVILTLSACERSKPEPPAEQGQWHRSFEQKPSTEPIEQDEPEQQESQAEPTSTQSGQLIEDLNQQSLQEIMEQPDELEYRLIGAPKPLHYGGIYRWEVKIEMPVGLEREQVAVALENAARGIARGRRADAVAVLAYTPNDNPELRPGIGEGVLAPNGEWADAGQPDPVMFKVVFVNESYLNPPEAVELFGPGTEVELRRGLWDEFIKVSRRKDEWGENIEIARVPEGTKAVILKRTSEALTPEIDFVRYRIEFEHEGRKLKGWVHKSAIEGAKEVDTGG